jgi:hypothetical protein
MRKLFRAFTSAADDQPRSLSDNELDLVTGGTVWGRPVPVVPPVGSRPPPPGFPPGFNPGGPIIGKQPV